VAMRVIQVPMREMLWPPKKSLKLRWRRARQAWEMPGAVGSPLAGRVVSLGLLNAVSPHWGRVDFDGGRQAQGGAG